MNSLGAEALPMGSIEAQDRVNANNARCANR